MKSTFRMLQCGILAVAWLLSGFTSMRRSDVVHYIYSHGGTVLSAPTRANDYLIVGGEKSKTWKYGHYGTKIRKGLDLREKDEKILIISEEDFMRCIGENISN